MIIKLYFRVIFFYSKLFFNFIYNLILFSNVEIKYSRFILYRPNARYFDRVHKIVLIDRADGEMGILLYTSHLKE